MTVLEAGTVLGVGIGIGSTLGQIIGGRVADRLARRDVHWYVVMPAITSVASVPLFACFLWAWDFGSAIGLYTVASAVGAAWSGPTWAMVQGISPPQMRATASAIVSFLLHLIGMGLGPLAVGALSDLLSPRFGPEALRYALLVIAVPHALAAIASLLARRTLVADLDRAQGEG
jgi:MFS family permease